MNIVAILITLLSGISFLIGYLITKLVKDDKKLITFSVGFSFTIILGIVLFDLLPESMELLNDKWLIVLCVIAGVLLLKMLDFFIKNQRRLSLLQGEVTFGFSSTFAEEASSSSIFSERGIALWQRGQR